MNRHCFQAFAVTSLLVATWAVDAKNATIIFYDIVGDNPRELRRQMDANGPAGKDGKRMDGRTDWHVAWTYRYVSSAGRCAFTDLDVTLTATMTLPRWNARGDIPDDLVKRWQSYNAALRVHENGHYSHGVKAAEEITSLRQSLHTSGDCPTMVKQFSDEAALILEKYRAADIAYDADTAHGRTQGATFP